MTEDSKPKEPVNRLYQNSGYMTLNRPKLYYYVIDWDKVKTLKDMKTVMKALNYQFSCEEDNIPDWAKKIEKFIKKMK